MNWLKEEVLCLTYGLRMWWSLRAMWSARPGDNVILQTPLDNPVDLYPGRPGMQLTNPVCVDNRSVDAYAGRVYCETRREAPSTNTVILCAVSCGANVIVVERHKQLTASNPLGVRAYW